VARRILEASASCGGVGGGGQDMLPTLAKIWVKQQTLSILQRANTPLGNILASFQLSLLPQRSPEVGLAVVERAHRHQGDYATVCGHSRKIPFPDADCAPNGGRQRATCPVRVTLLGMTLSHPPLPMGEWPSGTPPVCRQ